MTIWTVRWHLFCIILELCLLLWQIVKQEQILKAWRLPVPIIRMLHGLFIPCLIGMFVKLWSFKYRVSHSKEGKVILLWWGYRFWFLLIFWVLHVHEIGPFMPNSSVFIFLMLRALYFTILSNHPVVIPQSYCDVHLLRSVLYQF